MSNPLSKPPQFFHTDMQVWLSCNLLNNSKGSAGIPRSSVFVFTCSYIWKWRNQYVFSDEEDLPYCPQRVIMKAANEWVSRTHGAKLE